MVVAVEEDTAAVGALDLGTVVAAMEHFAEGGDCSGCTESCGCTVAAVVVVAVA